MLQGEAGTPHEGTTLLPNGSPGRLQLDEDSLDLMKSRRLLYLSHFFNQFSENSWQFCLVLFLAAFTNYQSLILVSSYGLVSTGSVCYFGSRTGRFIDGTNRLVVAQQFIGFENCAVLLATFCCYLLLSQSQGEGHELSTLSGSSRLKGVPTDSWSLFLLASIHILGATAKILDTGFLVAVERDWIVVMSTCIPCTSSDVSEKFNKQKAWLSDTNVAMKQIDLGCQVVAPTFAGLFVALFDDGTRKDKGANLVGAAVFVGILNAMALVVEYICTAKIYHDVPALAFKRVSSTLDIEKTAKIHDDANNHVKSRADKSSYSFFPVPEELKVYLEQDVCWAGIGLSLLYVNLLSFGGVMTAYLVWRGMRLDSIGFWRGISSAAGLAGTFVFHFLSRRISLISTGMLSVSFQFLCLTISFASLFIHDNPISLAMLIVGVCASRVGLWVFDITVTQLMQLHVQEAVRGSVGGTQVSLNNFFAMLAYVLGIFIPDPVHFHIYVSVGYTSVGVALSCYAIGVYARRKSLSMGGASTF